MEINNTVCIEETAQFSLVTLYYAVVHQQLSFNYTIIIFKTFIITH